ncbi:hypothetical protein ACFVG1_04435 [Streptomyces bacillaris]
MSDTTDREQTKLAERGSDPAEDPVLADLIWLQETREDRLTEGRRLR